MDDDNVILLFVGAIALIAIGYFAFSAYKKTPVLPTAPVAMTLTEDFKGTPDNPVGYYHDTVKQPQTYSPTNNAIVSNEENIKWTDWLGRDRTITISRTVH
jgi:hypothetical protein